MAPSFYYFFTGSTLFYWFFTGLYLFYWFFTGLQEANPIT